jgi:alkanesulfonate monooxygenase SsuD/methylene tetrahydromethanopterin reductase-like flavin-dependent oxidoreductase (luciferase family)
VLAAAIARETRRVRIGTSVVIAPFAHPLRIAEEFAMVDILSGGRLEFGLGRGYQPKEFQGLGASMDRTRESFDESLEIIRRAWTEERVSFDGEFHRVRDVMVLPKPIQKPHPPLWTAAVSPDTYTLAARRGLRILTAPSFTPWDILRKNYDAYRSEWRAVHGADGGEICMNKIIHVADSSRQARDELREPVRWFFRTQADLIADPVGAPPEQYRFYRKVRENLLSLTDEKALDQAAIVGDPEEVADKIRMHHEALGITYFMGSFSRGGLPHDKVVHSMRLFAEKVRPRVA